jgi:hypothetical protein
LLTGADEGLNIRQRVHESGSGPFASFRCGADLGRYGSIADIE